MLITPRDIDILKALVHYYVMSRPQIQSLFFPDDETGRATRRRMLMLISEHLVNRQKMLHAQPDGGSPACCYYPSAKGCAFLADETGDDHYRIAPTQSPNPFHIQHWLAITDTHIKLDTALKGQDLSVASWINEWDIVNKDEYEPERRFQLFTLIRESPRLVCAPDAAFLLSYRNHRKVYYLEQDRATSGIQQVANAKTRGYAVMAEIGLHHFRHFPDTTIDTFTVMMVAPTPRRRDSLRAAIAAKQGAALWKFAAASELKPETFLYEPIWYPCQGDPTALVTRKVEHVP